MFRNYLAGLAAGVMPFFLIGAGCVCLSVEDWRVGGWFLTISGVFFLAIVVYMGAQIYRQDVEIRYAPVIEFYVDRKTGQDGNDGRTLQTPFGTIGRAVRAAAGVKVPGRGVVIVVPDLGDPSAPLG